MRPDDSSILSGVMNVLITSAGRRTTLVDAFKKAVRAYGGRVLTADIDGLAPTNFVGDEALRVPPITDRGYIPQLLAYAEMHAIALLIPTIDTELAVLAAQSSAFEAVGCRVVISEPRLIEVVRDKFLAAEVFTRAGIACPDTWLSSDLPNLLPNDLICKPRSGSASSGVFPCSRDDLARVCLPSEDTLVQEYLEGPEITIDALVDFSGMPIHCVPRYRLKTIGGESVEGVTISVDPFRDWLENLLEAIGSLGAKGPMTIQAILTESGPVLIEVNPRFGGGFPLGLAAGGRYPEWLLKLHAGRRVEVGLFDYTVGLHMTRSYQEFITTEPYW